MGNLFGVTLRERLRDIGVEGHVASALLHAGLLFMFATAMARLDEEDRDDIDRDRLTALRAYLDQSAEREEEREIVQPDLGQGKPGVGDPRKDPGRDGWGDKGDMGRRAVTTHGHWSAKGSASKEDATLARARLLEEAATFGVIGLLAARAPDANAPIAPWGSVANGADAENHIGNNWAPTLDDAFGDGLGLSGGGEGGGGRGEGIGLGSVGTLGHGWGGCGGCNGRGVGRLGGSHVTRSPVLRCGPSPEEVARGDRGGCTVSVNGRLPPEVVQRVVRQNHGRFRACYEHGLQRNPSLAGRVAVKFVIDRTGAVSLAADAGSDLPDPGVSDCIVRAFGSLSFPEPEGGIVTVVYPLTLSTDAP